MADGSKFTAAAQPWRQLGDGHAVALPQIDREAFAAEITALRRELTADLGPADLAHLRKMERWGRACTLLGYACAWIVPNPIAAALLALGNVARWTMLTHHVMHRGYDRVPGVPARLTSKSYAIGWRRYLDWLDWMHPAAWAHEHNHLHHFHTGEVEDPDLVEHNAWLLRLAATPRPLKWLLAMVLMSTWKLSYYAPNTLWALQQQRLIRAQTPEQAKSQPLPTAGTVWRLLYPGERLLLPLSRRALEFYARCVLPYGLIRFGLIPALFLPLGTWAWAAVLINSLLAEVIANIHAFVIIVPNHAGDDVWRFHGRVKDKAEFYLRQVTGSVNYPGGSDARDFLMGYLNYQIEHHVWPDLPMLKYRQAAPRLKAICAKHGVPYIEQNVFARFRRMWAILMGDADMRRAP
ncbi:MAG TPA: fatty acid desaturase [Xanthomonadales bacterium]|nr:fatty acid desaturase [Xanthomonadales bacterium]